MLATSKSLASSAMRTMSAVCDSNKQTGRRVVAVAGREDNKFIEMMPSFTPTMTMKTSVRKLSDRPEATKWNRTTILC